MIRSLLIIVSLCLSLYSALGLEVTVEQIYYVDPPGSPTPPPPVNVTVPAGSFVIDVMYQAAQDRASEKDYNFGGDYYGEYDSWFITKYGEVSNDNVAGNYWLFYLEINGAMIEPNKGVSLVELDDVTKVIFRYGH